MLVHVRLTRTADGKHHALVVPSGEWPLDIVIDDSKLESLIKVCQRKQDCDDIPVSIRETLAGLSDDACDTLCAVLLNR